MTSTLFAERHIGTTRRQQVRMARRLGLEGPEGLVAAAIPENIREPKQQLDLPPPTTEVVALAELEQIADQNQELVSMIGMGYHATFLPELIVRDILKNPQWYTAYTPYQAEISQGRLEMLMLFQVMVKQLTGMAYANAGLLDEATAAAEAMAMCWRVKQGTFVVHPDCHPQTLAVLFTRAKALGIPIVVSEELPDGDICGVLLSYPGTSGAVRDYSELVAEAHARGALVVVACDLLALTTLTPPGEWGADIAIGSSQRFGMPMGYGGPHAAFMAVADVRVPSRKSGTPRPLVDIMPGRIVGLTVDSHNKPAYYLAKTIREQHIRREEATSNICTAQVLPAIVSVAYALYHGPVGLRRIATRVNRMASQLAKGLRRGGIEIVHEAFFDTVMAHVPGRAEEVVAAALAAGINLRLVDADHVGMSCDEATTEQHLRLVWKAFGVVGAYGSVSSSLPESLVRKSKFLTDARFRKFRSETALMRYLHSLASKDYSLMQGMIPLGSCTMKYNAAAAMAAITWRKLANIHPYVPADQAAGYNLMISQLEGWLAQITGFYKVSLQPNAGSQGEFAGLLAIRDYHASRGEGHRNVCLIPASAHGTNPASAIMAGMEVVKVKFDDQGNVDMDDLRAKIAKYGDRLAAIMITYPSTHGVYEESITEICALVHEAGGQVYVDGANLNALVGFARPGKFGADVLHINLHKTFIIPHGGGGPGVGPVAVQEHLAPFLPGNPQTWEPGSEESGPVSAANKGSALIALISWMYIRMMGEKGQQQATQVAVLHANYIAHRLSSYYPILFTGPNGLVAHECIIDLRPFKQYGISWNDIAKRLIDYGFHPPTCSFPREDSMMIEPTESESLEEIERFCKAMIAIYKEIQMVANGTWTQKDNPLVNAPHTLAELTADKWRHRYSRKVAAASPHFFAVIGRAKEGEGNRSYLCECAPMSAYAA